MSMNECKGCIYDLADTVVTNKDKLDEILRHCCFCKRGVNEDMANLFSDLYTTKKKDFNYEKDYDNKTA